MAVTTAWTPLAALADIPAGEMLAVQAGSRRLAIFHTEDGQVHVTDNVCTHEYALLTDGWLEGCEIECPLHAGRFDVRTGKGLCAPITADLAVYPAEIRDGHIYAAIAAAGA